MNDNPFREPISQSFYSRSRGPDIVLSTEAALCCMRPSNSSLNLISNSKPNLNANSASGAAGASAGSVPAAAAPSVEVVVKFDETHFVLVKGGTRQ